MHQLRLTTQSGYPQDVEDAEVTCETVPTMAVIAISNNGGDSSQALLNPDEARAIAAWLQRYADTSDTQP